MVKYEFDVQRVLEDLRRKHKRLGIGAPRTAAKIGIAEPTYSNYLSTRANSMKSIPTYMLAPILKYLGTKFEDYIIEIERDETDGSESE